MLFFLKFVYSKAVKIGFFNLIYFFSEKFKKKFWQLLSSAKIFRLQLNFFSELFIKISPTRTNNAPKC